MTPGRAAMQLVFPLASSVPHLRRHGLEFDHPCVICGLRLQVASIGKLRAGLVQLCPHSIRFGTN